MATSNSKKISFERNDLKSSSSPYLKLIMSFGESWKSLGNVAYKVGDFETAIKHYTQAIEAEPTEAKYFVNRSLAYAGLSDWKKSALDARSALQQDAKIIKAHYRLIKALFMLEKWKEARFALNSALKECGEQSKELKELEAEVLTRTGIPLRPKSTDFEVIGELGDGNFSKVYKAVLKSTDQVFAIKAIERAVVGKMKRRHPNIHNEILMEKRALQKLDHPGIVTLYSTFQDYGTLYYQMEYVGNGDLWTSLHEIIYESDPVSNAYSLSEMEMNEIAPTRIGATGAQLGLHWSLIRRLFAQMISAVEHMHRHGIIHRDIKPENIMVTNNGYLKFVDFGTAKDILQPDLNGPEFVGTPEYMCPGTVNVKGKSAVGLEADIWALGVTLHQMVLGYTAFAAPSPFLTFLRIKRARLRMPSWVPQPMRDMVQSLLTKDSQQRILMTTTGLTTALSSANTTATCSLPAEELKGMSYDPLRGHAFFSRWTEEVMAENVRNYHRHLSHPGNLLEEHEQQLIEQFVLVNRVEDDLATVEGVRSVYNQQLAVALSDSNISSLRIPSLHDLCIRAVGDAAVLVALESAKHGGLRPPDIPWMQASRFNLPQRLSSRDWHRVLHYLDRKQKMVLPGLLRLFYHSLPEAHCLRASIDTREYIGLNRSQQGHYHNDFHFALISDPCLSLLAGDESEQQLKNQVSAINKVRPKFVVITGNFTASVNSDHNSDESGGFMQHADKFRKTVARISDTVSTIFVPGKHDLGSSWLSLQRYRGLFGADYYAFWYEGTRGIVINSSLLFPLKNRIKAEGACSDNDEKLSSDKNQLLHEAKEQLEWLEEEIEQCKLCATSIFLFTYHPWFYHDVDEEEMTSDNGTVVKAIPRSIRLSLLSKLRHHKVRYVCSSAHRPSQESLSSEQAAGREASILELQSSLLPLKPFPKGSSYYKPMPSDDEPQQESEKVEEEASTAHAAESVLNVDDEEAVEGDKKKVTADKDDDESDEEGETEYVNEEDHHEGPELLFHPTSLRFVYVKENEALYKDFAAVEAVPKTQQELLYMFGVNNDTGSKAVPPHLR